MMTIGRSQCGHHQSHQYILFRIQERNESILIIGSLRLRGKALHIHPARRFGQTNAILEFFFDPLHLRRLL